VWHVASGGSYVDLFALAIVEAGLGDTTRMFDALDRAVATHNWALFFLHQHFALRKYFGDPRFVALVRRAGVR
jgi:hypothetical protein